MEKIEILEDIIGSSKCFEFETDEILNLRDYYTGRKNININFNTLIEIMRDKLDEEDIDRILLTDEEVEEVKNMEW